MEVQVKHEPLRCVGTGLVVLDVVLRRADSNTIMEHRFAGGTCANVLTILAFLGSWSAPVGRIGADETGRELVEDLARFGVVVDFLTRESKQRTPVIIQDSYTDRNGRPHHRFSWACPTCGARMPSYRPLLLADVPNLQERIPTHDVFFFDRVTPGTVALAEASRRRGALVVFEPSGIKDERLFRRALAACHVFKYSDERLATADVSPLAESAGVNVQVATFGELGLDLRIGSRAWTRLPAIPAPRLRDAAGSGDWCTAGMILRLATAGTATSVDALASPDLVRSAVRFGQAFAALNCAFDGARGLMYAMDRDVTLSAAEALLLTKSKKPHLPMLSDTEAMQSSRTELPKSESSADIHAAHA